LNLDSRLYILEQCASS